MKPIENIRSKNLEKMILEELDRTDLQAEIDRTLKSCRQILAHFPRGITLDLVITNKQRKKLYTALHSTISHVDELIEEVKKVADDGTDLSEGSLSVHWEDRQVILELERTKLKEVFESI